MVFIVSHCFRCTFITCCLFRQLLMRDHLYWFRLKQHGLIWICSNLLTLAFYRWGIEGWKADLTVELNASQTSLPQCPWGKQHASNRTGVLIVEEVDHPLRFTSGCYSLAVIEPKNLWAADRSTITGNQDLSQSSISSRKPYGDGSAKSRESVTSN